MGSSLLADEQVPSSGKFRLSCLLEYVIDHGPTIPRVSPVELYATESHPYENSRRFPDDHK
jgi:hypothetical protein